MRVALVVERFEAAGGGVENVVWYIARELVRAGDAVSVLARRATPATGVVLQQVPAPSFWQPLRVSMFAQRTREKLRDLELDVVHSFCRTLRQDIFDAGGGSHEDYMLNTYGETGTRLRKISPRHALQLYLERRIFRDPDTIVQCVSGKVQRELSARYGTPTSRLPVIEYGVDTKRFDPEYNAHARGPLRSQYAAGSDTVWLFAGSGWRRKGLDIALETLAGVANPALQLWVAGRDDPTSWRTLARRLGISDRVRFLGNRTDLEHLYAAADGLFLPTRYDAFGLVCLEAAASGRAVVTSDDAGAAELFGDCGRVVSRGDGPEAYAQTLDELCDSKLRDELGAKARKMAMQHDWTSHVERLRELYAGIRK
jgi:UDP-glucose:(heptosyl)LPS alpha-1,3-glucosyltransferase